MYKIIRDINLIEIFEHRRVIDYENMNIQSCVMATVNVYIHYTKFLCECLYTLYQIYSLDLWGICIIIIIHCMPN